MTFETAAAEIGSMLDTPLVPEPVVGERPDFRLNIITMIDDGGRPRHDLSSGERALVSLALDVHRGTGFVAALAALDREQAVLVCEVVGRLFRELPR